MFYTAYFKQGAPAAGRPITFLFNGGPGLVEHLAAHGCVRAGARRSPPTPRHNPPAPYSTVNNDQSLLDASDLVFIDAPGTGFSRIAGKDKEKAFYGVDQDIHAFTDFITQFLTNTAAGTRPNMCSARAMGRCARPACRSRCRTRTSTSTA